MTTHETGKGLPYPDAAEALTLGAAAIQALAEALDRRMPYAASVSDPDVTGDARFFFAFPSGWFPSAPAVTVGVEQLGAGSSGMTFRHRVDSLTASGCYVAVSPSNATAAYGVKVSVIALVRNN